MSDTRGYKYKYTTAAAELGTGFGVTGAYPLDCRLSVASLLDFYDSSAITIYQDMFFVADDTKKLYIVTDKPENALTGSDCTIKEVGKTYKASDFDIKDLDDTDHLKQKWDGKQDALTAGNNISIENDTNNTSKKVIKAKGYTYTDSTNSFAEGNKTVTTNDSEHAEGKWNKSNSFTTPELVDFGLPSGILWAKTNIGATTESDHGNYFLWGSTTPLNVANNVCDPAPTWDSCPYTDSNGNPSKYTGSDYNILQSEDDAATAIYGSSYRIPTKADFEELILYTTASWETIDSKNGLKFSNSDRTKYIFFPAGGYYTKDKLEIYGNNGSCLYWLSDLGTEDKKRAARIYKTLNGSINTDDRDRCLGLNIRAVALQNTQRKDIKTRHSIGIGSSENDRKNALEVMDNGDIYIAKGTAGLGNYDGTNPADAKTLQQLIKDAGSSLVPATETILGGIKVGEGLHMESGALSAATSSDINPVNKDEITFNSFRNALIEDGQVKDGLTFEKFIETLFCKRNDEKVLQDILNKLNKKVDLPSVIISGSADNTDPVFIESCTNMGTSYTINRTVSYSYSPGKIYYWKFTDGKSTDEILNFTDTGCSINNNKWSDNSTDDTVIQEATYTIPTTATDSEATLIDTSISVNSIYYKFGYSASTKETPDADTGKSLVTTSYGNNLYSSSTKAIPAGSNKTSNEIQTESRSIKTYFYYGFSRKNQDNTYTNTVIAGPGEISKKEIKWGDEYYFPEGSTVQITYTTGGAEATLSPENDELTSGYMSLPCEGKLAAKFSLNKPTNARYKIYKKWVISESKRHPQVIDPAIVNTVKITFS